MDLPFGANPKLKGVNLESHELNVMGQAKSKKCPGIEDTQGSSSPTVPTSSEISSTGNTKDSIMSRSIDSTASASNGHMVTMTGTIKRGHNIGELVEVQLQLSEDELSKLQQSYIEEDKTGDSCVCGVDKGVHIVFLTLLCLPFAFIGSVVMSFYIGTIAWYNVYLNLSEERTVWHKIFFCPLLILTFPLFIVLSAVCIGLYAAVVQVSWFCSSWRREIWDFEKGFYGWMCHKLDMPQCAPYEVVILDETNPAAETSQTSTRNVSV